MKTKRLWNRFIRTTKHKQKSLCILCEYINSCRHKNASPGIMVFVFLFSSSYEKITKQNQTKFILIYNKINKTKIFLLLNQTEVLLIKIKQ